jgi:hypothetical protein
MQEFRKVLVKPPQQFLDLVNQIFEIEKKSALIKEDHSLQRNINKLKSLIENELFKGSGSTVGFTYHNPLGERYNETRADCEASIAGTSSENLEIVEVIKPIIYYSSSDQNIIKTIVQKAIVVVKSKS